MRLLGGVLNDGHTVGQGGGQHDIHGGTHGHHIQIDLSAGQPAAPGHLGIDQAVSDLHLGPHGYKALDMLVDGPSAQIAASGQGHFRPAEAAQKGAHQIVAGADPAGQLIGHLAVADMGAVHVHRGPVHRLHVGAQLPQNLEDQRNVADLRNVFNAADPVHHQGGGNNGNSGVFRSADLDGPMEGLAPADLILGQIMHLL